MRDMRAAQVAVSLGGGSVLMAIGSLLSGG